MRATCSNGQVVCIRKVDYPMIKIDIVSGFLGAGKTTLIQKLLKACAEENEKLF